MRMSLKRFFKPLAGFNKLIAVHYYSFATLVVNPDGAASVVAKIGGNIRNGCFHT